MLGQERSKALPRHQPSDQPHEGLPRHQPRDQASLAINLEINLVIRRPSLADHFELQKPKEKLTVASYFFQSFLSIKKGGINYHVALGADPAFVRFAFLQPEPYEIVLILCKPR